MPKCHWLFFLEELMQEEKNRGPPKIDLISAALRSAA